MATSREPARNRADDDDQEPALVAPLAKFSYLTTRYPQSSHFPYTHLLRIPNLLLIIERVPPQQRGGSQEQFKRLKVVEGSVVHVCGNLHGGRKHAVKIHNS